MMFDSGTCDLTPIESAPYVNEWRQPPEKFLPIASKNRPIRTEFFAYKGMDLEFFGETIKNISASDADGVNFCLVETVKKNVKSVDPVKKAAADRTFLLARKYGAGLDREESSRLEILTERLRSMSPRVTLEHANELEETVAKLEERSVLLAEIKKRYMT